VFSKQAGTKGAKKNTWKCPLCGDSRIEKEFDGYCMKCWLTGVVRTQTKADRKAAKKAAREAKA
jgi:hypothetical protein